MTAPTPSRPLVRSQKSRILEKAGLRYVAGWVKADDAPAILAQIEAQENAAAKALASSPVDGRRTRND